MTLATPHSDSLHVPHPSPPGAPPLARAWHPTRLILVLTLWISTVGNLPLWLALGRLPELQSARAVLGVLGLALALAGLLFATLAHP